VQTTKAPPPARTGLWLKGRVVRADKLGNGYHYDQLVYVRIAPGGFEVFTGAGLTLRHLTIIQAVLCLSAERDGRRRTITVSSEEQDRLNALVQVNRMLDII
jgi:hypothetical protein